MHCNNFELGTPENPIVITSSPHSTPEKSLPTVSECLDNPYADSPLKGKSLFDETDISELVKVNGGVTVRIGVLKGNRYYIAELMGRDEAKIQGVAAKLITLGKICQKKPFIVETLCLGGNKWLATFTTHLNSCPCNRIKCKENPGECIILAGPDCSTSDLIEVIGLGKPVVTKIYSDMWRDFFYD